MDNDFRNSLETTSLLKDCGTKIRPVISGEQRFEKGDHLLVLGTLDDARKATK